jgi:hypothetical protein
VKWKYIGPKKLWAFEASIISRFSPPSMNTSLAIVATRSDTEAAQRMQQAKRKLFEQLRLPAGVPWK